MGRHIVFSEVVKLLLDYKKAHGNFNIHVKYEVDNVRLGYLVQNIRTGNRKTTVEEKAKLDSIGFVWRVKSDTVSFEEIFNLLENFKKEFGHCCVPITYEVDNIKLGQIVSSIRSANRRTTSKEQEMLNSIGFAWKIKNVM